MSVAGLLSGVVADYSNDDNADILSLQICRSDTPDITINPSAYLSLSTADNCAALRSYAITIKAKQ